MLRPGAGQFSPHDLALYDYLFRTAATLRDGFAVGARFLYLVTANSCLRVSSETDSATTYSYLCPGGGGDPAETALRESVILLRDRARQATGCAVVPVRVKIRPPVAEFTFAASDLDLPMREADAALARILIRHAESLPTRVVISWHDCFREQLLEEMEDGSASLGVLASRLLISPRTLQRRLADHGTTWRAELDIARRRRFDDAGLEGTLATHYLARQLGFADERSFRRARRRWESLSVAVPR